MSTNRKQQLKEFTDWAKEQLKSMGTYAQEMGVIPQEVTVKAYWALPNKVCIGKVWPKLDPANAFWVISGDLTADHFEASAAASAREAARHFALRWQLHSAQLAQGLKDETDSKIDWQKVANQLAEKAEYLYGLVEDDEIWKYAVDPAVPEVTAEKPAAPSEPGSP